MRELQTRLSVQNISTLDLLNGRYKETTQEITVTCATDGNHGRSVAWGAQQFGCRCVIYIHETVSEGRKQAIEHYGAEVIRTAGNYDDSVRIAAQDAEQQGRFVVSDTSYEGYTEVPKDVMQGYTVMVDETLSQLGDARPTHIYVQGGVGGLAAAVLAPFWQRHGSQRPRFIVVEPDRADCIFQSIKAGQRINLSGDLDTVMAGLACGEVSLLAWELLREGADAVMSVSDDAALDCMRLLADGINNDPPIVAGESAVAGLAGLLASAADPALRQALGLDENSRVLLIGSEGDTDPELYRSIVGRGAAEVRSTA
jgi:diaminopropionate ammonia-lyase